MLQAAVHKLAKQTKLNRSQFSVFPSRFSRIVLTYLNKSGKDLIG